MGYRNARADRLHRLAWESGKSLPDHIKEKMSPAEVTYYYNYIETINEYNKRLGEMASAGTGAMPLNIDLTVDMTPPKDLFIEVRVKQSGYGTVMLPESGEVNLAMGTTHFLRRSEVDHLIKKGVLD